MRIHTLDLDFMGHAQAIAAFVAEGPDGLALIECGPASTLPALEATLAQRGWALSDFRHLFLSHIHFDHAGAAWALARQGATVCVHPKGLPHLAAPEKLYTSARMIYGDDMERLWGPMHPIAAEHLYAPAHGEVIEAVGLRFTAWHTPGHAVHHIAWQVAAPDGSEHDVLFTGDVAGVRIAQGPVVPPCPPPDIQVEHWQESIRLIRDLPVQRLYLTHFGVVGDKMTHLQALEGRLLQWASWMRPYAEADTPTAEVVPLFQAFVADELHYAGVDAAGVSRYDAANPAFMSVAGLMRYWKKKGTVTAG